MQEPSQGERVRRRIGRPAFCQQIAIGAVLIAAVYVDYPRRIGNSRRN